MGPRGRAYKAGDSPEELAHGDASLVEHGGDDLGQVEPDVGDVYGHVLSHLQDLLEPAHTERPLLDLTKRSSEKHQGHRQA